MHPLFINNNNNAPFGCKEDKSSWPLSNYIFWIPILPWSINWMKMMNKQIQDYMEYTSWGWENILEFDFLCEASWWFWWICIFSRLTKVNFVKSSFLNNLFIILRLKKKVLYYFWTFAHIIICNFKSLHIKIRWQFYNPSVLFC